LFIAHLSRGRIISWVISKRVGTPRCGVRSAQRADPTCNQGAPIFQDLLNSFRIFPGQEPKFKVEFMMNSCFKSHL